MKDDTKFISPKSTAMSVGKLYEEDENRNRIVVISTDSSSECDWFSLLQMLWKRWVSQRKFFYYHKKIELQYPCSGSADEMIQI